MCVVFIFIKGVRQFLAAPGLLVAAPGCSWLPMAGSWLPLAAIGCPWLLFMSTVDPKKTTCLGSYDGIIYIFVVFL